MSNILELAGRRALVTGATKGVGHAVAARLREAGAAVLGTARARPADLSAEELFVTANVATAEGRIRDDWLRGRLVPVLMRAFSEGLWGSLRL
jgi:NAD(P)-dependent dehydrogenase (short-subunit alcohol dehydrogenase family)